jgi:RNA polymerase primary sigma factor
MRDQSSPSPPDDSPAESQARVRQCVALLLDDRARQGGFLSADDVNRILSRRKLTSGEAVGVWTGLATAGACVELPPAVDRPHPSSNNQVETERAAPADGLLEMAGGTHPLLSHDEEVQLARRIRSAQMVAGTSGLSIEERNRIVESGDVARAQLIMSNLRLVIHYAKQHAAMSSLSVDDLVQEGILGLFRAAEKYDPELGFKFSTYASWWINQSISRAIDTTGRTIRIPAHVLGRLRKLQRKRRRLSITLRYRPASHELANDLGCSVGEVEFLLRIEQDVKSLDHELPRSDGETLQRSVRSRTESPTEAAERHELKRIVRGVLETLDQRSSRILEMRFGLNGRRPRTLEQIAKKLGLTRERVRQIQKHALEKVSRGPRGSLLRPFVEMDERNLGDDDA